MVEDRPVIRRYLVTYRLDGSRGNTTIDAYTAEDAAFQFNVAWESRGYRPNYGPACIECVAPLGAEVAYPQLPGDVGSIAPWPTKLMLKPAWKHGY